MVQLKRILFPTDFSCCSKRAQEYACALADQFQAERHILHVLSCSPTPRQVCRCVIGTHGRTALLHMLLGSVAERVVRKAPCPVLTVHPAGHQFVDS